MSQEDPFADLTGNDENDRNRTVIVPRPGGLSLPDTESASPVPGSEPVVSAPPQAPAYPPPEAAPQPSAPPRSTGLNPLEQAASHLLSLIPKLRSTISHPDPEGLRQQVIRDIRGFEQRLQQSGIDPKTLMRARYVLCTAIDEAVLNTPWGNTGSWNKNSLLVTFHNEAGGGDKFFVLLHHLLQSSAANIDLLELMYLCLALGFQGRYGVRGAPQGGERLEQVKDNLYRTIRTQRGDPERDLSLHWRGVGDVRKSLARFVPAWVFAALAGLLLVVTYMYFAFDINAYSDPVLNLLTRVDKGVMPPDLERRPLPPRPIPAAEADAPHAPTVAELLVEEIRAHRVAVEEDHRRAHVTVLGGALFASGRAAIAAAERPVFERVAWALDQVPGPILVTGHTDSVPIRRSLRFRSNHDLSKARAKAVAKLLEECLSEPGRITAEGRADTERLPGLAGKDARNRRVEIYLTKAPGGRRREERR
jgi:type VI secretion system protein ImpK